MAKQHDISGGLFYIIGASGAGKDSLIRAVCELSQAQDRLRIATRYITRPVTELDQHIEISTTQFAERRASGDFLFDWSAHSFEYAISTDVRDWVAAGQRVLIDGSRAYLDQARRRYPALKVIGIDVNPECIPARLRQRGRETVSAISERLQRNAMFESSLTSVDWRIENNRGISYAATQLLAIIRAN